MSRCVISLLNEPNDPSLLERVAAEFGWDVVTANPATFRAFDPGRIAAILFDHGSSDVGWIAKARRLRSCYPDARLIACHGFSDEIDWPALSDAGVFHAIRLPLRQEELRQSLGYVWALEGHAERTVIPIGRAKGSRAAA